MGWKPLTSQGPMFGLARSWRLNNKRLGNACVVAVVVVELCELSAVLACCIRSGQCSDERVGLDEPTTPCLPRYTISKYTQSHATYAHIQTTQR